MPGAPDYYKSILLYGLYNGAPVPAAVDEQGRFIFVPSSVTPFTTAAIEVYRDEFSEGLVHANVVEYGTLADVSVTDSESYAGSYACKLTAGSDGLALAGLDYYIQISSFKKIGLEFSVRWGNYIDYFFAMPYICDGAYSYLPWLQLDWTGTLLKVYDYLTASWKTIVTYPTEIRGTKWFHTYKLVVDLENNRYHSFRYVGGTIDLTAYGLNKAALVTCPHMECAFRLHSQAGHNAEIALDDIRFTQDEPT